MKLTTGIITTATTTTAIIALLVGEATKAAASGCSVPRCGRVNNGSPWTLKWADFSGGDDLCHVYNWHDGDGGESWDDKRGVACQQYFLAAGDDKGGYFNDGIDVDGFCYADRGYTIQWHDGNEYDFGAGVWTKISSSQTALCRNINARPKCYIA